MSEPPSRERQTDGSLSPEACALERFPHVQARICLLWPSPELNEHINRLLTDTRNGQRKGFPSDATAELLFLAELNKMVRAIDMARQLKIPLREAYHKVDRQDSGDPVLPAMPDTSSGRSSYVGEIPEPASSRPARRVQQSNDDDDGLIALLGKGIFSLLTSRWLIIILILVAAYKYAGPYLLKI